MIKKKVVFLTGTRADFGKLKSLIEISINSKKFDVYIFVTGMHMNPRYGNTYDEIIKEGYENVYLCSNHTDFDSMDIILAKTIEVFSQYINHINPDLIIIHGDRVEPLAAAIVGSLNNVLTAHIEGGEVTGTVDELIRHAVSKLSHLHLVSNERSKKRLIQMGEDRKTVFVIGSPDIDLMFSKKLPTIEFVKKRYDVNFENYAISIFHPVVSEVGSLEKYSKNFVSSLIKSKLNYIVIKPNNDKGCEYILEEYKMLEKSPNFKIFPSIRFENFLVFLKNCKFIIGNSSSGLREAPYYKIPTINIGSRQSGRLHSRNIINCGYSEEDISGSIKKALKTRLNTNFKHFGQGNSDKLFLKLLLSKHIWKTNKQKRFKDLRK